MAVETDETSRRIASLRARFATDVHLDLVEEIAPYIDGRLRGEAKRSLEAHLENCDVCRREVEELQRFAQPRRRARRRAIAAIAAAASVAVVVIAALIQRQAPPPPRVVRRAQQALTVSLRDGDRIIGIDGKGALHGLSVDSDTARRAASLIARPDLAAPPALASLAGGSQDLRGPAAPVSSIEVVSPAGIAVIDTRPELIWSARSTGPYRLTITSPDGTPVHGVTADKRWTPPSPLERGRTYAWQVAATIDGKRVVAPSPPDPPALFRVVDQATADAIRNANSHLVAGMLAYEAGALADARREFALLADANASSPIPARLIASCDRAMGR